MSTSDLEEKVSTFSKSYRRIIKGRTSHSNNNRNEIEYWKNKLFINFLFYCLPVSFIAVVPGVYMALKDGYNAIGIVDLVCLSTIAWVTFHPQLGLKLRKLMIVGTFYLLASFLVVKLGYMGPGVFYLLTITILSALVLSFRIAYWTIVVNAMLLGAFAVVIAYKMIKIPLLEQYTAGQWIAFSSNLVFISVLLVVLIHKIFNGLQQTITNTNNLQKKYQTIFEQSPVPMWLFDVDTLMFLDVNSAAVEHYGYSKAEFLDMTIKDIRPDCHRDLVEQIIRICNGLLKPVKNFMDKYYE